MNGIIRRILVLSIAIGSTCSVDARTWTIDGKTKIDAEFSGMMGDIVFLHQANGSSYKFKLASFSSEDQAFIKEYTRGGASVVPTSPAPSAVEPFVANLIDMAPNGSKPVSFRGALITAVPGTVIGTAHFEPGDYTQDIRLPPISVNSEQYAVIVREELRKLHYSLLGGENLIFNDDNGAKARYEIGAEVSGLRLNIYYNRSTAVFQPEPLPPQIPGNVRVMRGPTTETTISAQYNSSMSVDWKVYDTLAHKVVYTHRTDISDRNKIVEGYDAWILRLFRKGLYQLLSDQSFADFMKPAANDQNDLVGTSFSTALEIPSFQRGKPMALPTDFPLLVDSVVTIKPGAGFGTGFLITENGYVLTAAHVVSGLKTVSVRLHNGLVLDAEVIRVDEGADVALIKLPGTSHRPIEITPDAVAVGTDVYAIGNPALEELSSSVTKGVISANREIDGRKLIQTDVSASPGNSGGPLISKDGRVIGIISWKIAGTGFEGLVFAVPISEAVTKLNLKFVPTAAQ